MVALFVWWPYQPWSFGEKLSVLGGWSRVLATDDSGEWIFCPFVPVLSIVLGWRMRHELRKLPVRGSLGGLWIVLGSLFLFWAGYKAGTGYPGFAATQCMVAGLIVWFCGWAWMRALAFPWMFLVFMWPSFPLEAQLALPMRLMTASLTSKLLAVIGIAGVNEGTSLVSAADVALGRQPGDLFKLDVAAPCSGIRSLYALLMLAALYGYVFLRRWRPRGVLFLSALPLAIAGNLVRMMLLALGSIWWGSEFAVGKSTADGEEISWFHELAGFAVFAVALGGMFVLSSVLENSRWNRKSKIKPSQDASRDDDSMRITLRRATMVLGLAGGVLTLCSVAGSQPPLSEPGVSLELPRTLGSAEGTDYPMTDRERAALSSDVTLNRMIYMAPSTRPTQASVVLSGESRRGLHIPEGCTIGQGWTITDREVIPLKIGDHEFSAGLLRVFMDVKDSKSGSMVRRRGIHVYWFQGVHHASAPSYYGHVFRTYWDAVFRNLNHRWAFVSFFTFLPDSTPGVSDGLEELTAVEDLKLFISEIGPKLIKP